MATDNNSSSTLSSSLVLQPPVLDLGISSGVVIFLPNADRVGVSSNATKTLDPEPLTKWTKEGFAVVAVTDFDGLVAEEALKQGLDALQGLDKVVKDKFAVIGGRFL